MLQKKVCMVGLHGTGKTSLVQRFVHSIFSPRYLSTVGVKIDRKEVTVDGQPVMLLLWDLEGRDDHQDVNASYLRGAHGLIYVVDGTRRQSYDEVFGIRDTVTSRLGAVPSVVAVNKIDLADQWQLSPADEASLERHGLHRVRTSAKTGEGVEAMFQWLAQTTVGGGAP